MLGSLLEECVAALPAAEQVDGQQEALAQCAGEVLLPRRTLVAGLAAIGGRLGQCMHTVPECRFCVTLRSVATRAAPQCHAATLWKSTYALTQATQGQVDAVLRQHRSEVCRRLFGLGSCERLAPRDPRHCDQAGLWEPTGAVVVVVLLGPPGPLGR